MRRFAFGTATVALAAVALAVPAPASAQLHFLMEAGLSSPAGSFSKLAQSGYMGRVGLEADIPGFPLAFRAEGEADQFRSATSAGHVLVVCGSGSAIYSFGGLGVSPYVLAGVGQYRTSFTTSGLSSAIGTGYHVGVGLHLGPIGFVELRYVYVKGDSFTTRYFPITLGLRL